VAACWRCPTNGIAGVWQGYIRGVSPLRQMRFQLAAAAGSTPLPPSMASFALAAISKFKPASPRIALRSYSERPPGKPRQGVFRGGNQDRGVRKPGPSAKAFLGKSGFGWPMAWLIRYVAAEFSSARPAGAFCRNRFAVRASVLDVLQILAATHRRGCSTRWSSSSQQHAPPRGAVPTALRGAGTTLGDGLPAMLCSTPATARPSPHRGL